MCPYSQALQADNTSALAAEAVAQRIALQYWPTSEGLDVVRVERTPEGFGDVQQLRTLHLCERGRALVRGM